MITILTVDEFMPVVTTPPAAAAAPSAGEATISPDGTYVQFAATSQWIDGDTVNDTPAIKVGDLVLYVGNNGNAIQTVTSIDTPRIASTSRSNANDFFHFNQPNATTLAGTTAAARSRPMPLGDEGDWPATSAWHDASRAR